jgi:hypothetical protein
MGKSGRLGVGSAAKSSGSPEGMKKNLVYGVIIAVCLAGAVVAYVEMSDNSPKQTPQQTAVDVKAAQIQASIEEAQKKEPQSSAQVPPPKFNRRGSVPVK